MQTRTQQGLFRPSYKIYGDKYKQIKVLGCGTFFREVSQVVNIERKKYYKN
jgi:hypothetical protein